MDKNTKQALSELLNFIVIGGTLLLAFIFKMAFWIIIFYKVGLIWFIVLFLLHLLYEKLEASIWH